MTSQTITAKPLEPAPPVGRLSTSRLVRMAEELLPEAPFGVQGANENIWHIAAAERWSGGALIGHRTFCGRNYGEPVTRRELADLSEICSDCTAQVTQRH